MFTLALAACAPAKSPALSDTELIFSLFSPSEDFGGAIFRVKSVKSLSRIKIPALLRRDFLFLYFSFCFFLIFRIGFLYRFDNLPILFAEQYVNNALYAEKQHKCRKNGIHNKKRSKIAF